MPALPLDEAGRYVAAAYLVVFALVLVYVAIMGVRLARLERDVTELDELAAERDARDEVPAGSTLGDAPAGREAREVVE